MHSVTIDAGVLAAPSGSVHREEVYDYIDTLLDWSRLLEEPWISIYMSERASETLIESGLYPLRDSLRNLFSSKGVTEYDVNTVVVVAERLLQMTPYFETYFRIKDVLLENLVTEPDVLSLTVGEGMASDLGRCIVLFALLRKHCANAVRNHTLILKRIPSSGSILVRAVIHAIEHSRDDLSDFAQAPEVFNGSVLACRDFRGLISNIDESAVWLAATDETGKEIAIRIAVYKSRINRGLDQVWDINLPLRFGRRFLAKVDDLCNSVDTEDFISKLLRSMTETIEGENMAAVHALRINDSGGSPQRIRVSDQAKAWRRDIDYEFHLHYWECDGGIIEFGSVGPHNASDLPE